MANAPKKKGTAGETELRKILFRNGIDVHRTSAGRVYDLERTGLDGETPVQALATRPDKGQWLVTMSLDDFMWMFNFLSPTIPLHIEVKRYVRFALHSIWNKKFGGG